MGAGQIGGIATLLDIDFKNAAGFQGVPTKYSEAQFMTYYMSHAMLFCTGVLIEAHVVLTPASCVYGERYKFEVFAGTHKFLERAGTSRVVEHMCLHRGYNHSTRWQDCSTDNVALLVLNRHYTLDRRERGSDFIVSRIRYGITMDIEKLTNDNSCRYYGWGSRRNGYLIPLLIHLYRHDVRILPSDRCVEMWNYKQKYLCVQQPLCKTDIYGALCPDDVGSVIVCSGYAYGMMTSRMIDRPCGVGFLDLSQYNKFLTCGVDDSREVSTYDGLMAFDFTTLPPHARTPTLLTAPPTNETTPEETTPEETTLE